MPALEKSLRRKLESIICQGRRQAEKAATDVVQAAGIHEAKVPSHFTAEQRALHARLREHALSLGDIETKGVLATRNLVTEIAYEHWHRMLFARFLASNGLLMHPSGVAVTLMECEELGRDGKGQSKWEVAADFASRMLPQIFRVSNPSLAISLHPSDQQALEELIESIPEEVFSADDSLGWVYQFWQSERKDEINASEVAIGADELSAVTQLFTEPYMVSFLLDNALGAWWAGKRLTPSDFQNASSEEELRNKASIPGVPLSYLRFVRTDSGAWEPASGTFPGWPSSLSVFKVLDPCCGSGHFLVGVFKMLTALRVEMDHLSPREAVDAVLNQNLHGLELDRRCVEIAAFALAMAAWQYPGAEGYRPLPDFHLACSGLSATVGKEVWETQAQGNQNLRLAMRSLYDIFHNAPTLGSLINPPKTEAAKMASWKELQGALCRASAMEPVSGHLESGVVAKGLATAAVLLSDQYHWVITNVPYLSRGKQVEILKDFCQREYPEGKSDLATAFLDRCLEYCLQGGSTSVVLPQNWLFLTSYKNFREKLLRNDTWHLIARLGSGAFETISGEVVKAILINLSRGSLAEEGLFNQGISGSLVRGIDVSDMTTPLKKAEALIVGKLMSVGQKDQLGNPDAVVSLEVSSNLPLLFQYAFCYQGTSTADNAQFQFNFWEQPFIKQGWEMLQNAPEPTGKHYSGRELVVSWKKLENSSHGFAIRGKEAWQKKGISLAPLSSMPSALYNGTKFTDSAPTIVTKNPDIFPALVSYVRSGRLVEELRKLNQKVVVNNGYVNKVPFDLDYWTKVAAEKYPHGLPQPYTNDPTQWIFHGYPCGSVVWDDATKKTAHAPHRLDETVLQVAVARLLGYRWPAELDEKMELAPEQREWVKRCEGLFQFADADGIVCIPSVRGEAAMADRLMALLEVAYGKDQTVDVSALIRATGSSESTLEDWLRNGFFEQHCRMFHHRPFIWHIWDGERDGFSAIVNYHKLDRKGLESLIFTYLADWITRQKKDVEDKVKGAEGRLVAANQLKTKLEAILEGEAPLDIFVRWKPLEEQPIGWEPDLNDGVRLNIRPFMTAGVLRHNKAPKINVKWEKDRGKDVESAPWFKVFKGDRVNDHHLSLDEKRKARSKAVKG